MDLNLEPIPVVEKSDATPPPIIAKPVSLPTNSEADQLFGKHMYSKSKMGTNALAVSNSLELTFKNPCTDAAFVTIQTEALVDQSYELYEYDPVGFEFTHQEFKIQTVPISHELCGGLTYTSTFNGLAINSSSAWPVKYNGSSLQHSVYSEDTSLLNMTNGTTVL